MTTDDPLIGLVDALPDGAAIHRDGTILHVNPALIEMLGFTADELVGSPVIEFVHPEDRAGVVARIRQMLGTGLQVPTVEERFLHKDGTVVTAEVQALPIVLRGEPALVAIGRDVTERRWMEERLHRADRLASLGTLAAGVAHEINNPLTYVLGGVDLAMAELQAMQERDTLDRAVLDRVLRRLERVHGGAGRIAEIIGDLRVFARPTDAGDGVVDLVQVSDEAVELVRGEVQSRARLVVEHGRTPLVIGNRRRLVQVLVNLLVNAAQAIEMDTTNATVRLSTGIYEDGRAMVEVLDTGAGVPAEVLPRVFEPYVTTKVGGTGLGLWVCHEVVTSLGGLMSLSSEPGETVVRILLPPAPAGRTPEPAPKVTPRTPTARRRVVVVDDEPLVAEMVVEALSDEHEVVAFSRPADAVIWLRGADPFPDVVFCDLVMPCLSGRELYEAVASTRPGCESAIVFITGGAYNKTDRAFLSRVRSRVLHKPFRAEELRRILDEQAM